MTKSTDSRLLSYTLTGCWVAFAVVAVSSAWMSDDAYITLRTVDNFVNGFGLRWNVLERVQAYTHPLWMLLLLIAYVLTQEAYLTPLLLSLSISILTFRALSGQPAFRCWPGVLGLCCLVSSKAFVDYATSGLENPLTYLLLVAYIYVLCGSGQDRWTTYTRLNSVACLATLNRMDTILLFLPGILAVGSEIGPRQAIRRSTIAFLPLAAWLVGSTVYYGFPFPNTAYAKLGTGIPSADLWEQGLRYLMTSVVIDPVIVAILVVGIVAICIKPDRINLVLGSGCLLYLIYVVSIGGDFMAGRFLTGPLLLLAVSVARSHMSQRLAVGGGVAVVLVSMSSPLSPFWVSLDYGTSVRVYPSGVVDERGFYYPGYGLLPSIKRGTLPFLTDRVTFDKRSEPVLRGDIGFAGFAWGPDDHIVDEMALGDPLLSRLPSHDIPWRIGHFRRAVPRGYLETVTGNTVRIVDPGVALYYEGLQRITRGPIWSGDRWRDIARYNLGLSKRVIEHRHIAQEKVINAIEASAKGNAGRSIALFEQAIQLDPENAEAAFRLATLYRETGRLERAAERIMDACKLRPDRVGYFDELARVAFQILKSDRVDRAMALYQSGVLLKRDLPQAQLNLGFFYASGGHRDKALRALLFAMLSGGGVGAEVRHGLAKQGLGRDVYPELSDLAQLDPAGSRYWVELAGRFGDIGERRGRWDAIEKGILTCGFDDVMIDAFRSEVSEHFDRGDWSVAGLFLEEVLGVNQELGLAYYYAGICHESLGQYHRAVRAHERSVFLEPDQPLGRDALKRARRSLAASMLQDIR